MEMIRARVRSCATAIGLALLIAACSASPPQQTEQLGTGSSQTSDDVVPVSGEAFSDPQGAYTVRIGKDWGPLPGTFVDEIETWSVAEPADGFGANVNVLTQAAPGMDLSSYLDLTVDSIDTIDELTLIEASIVEGANGNQLGLIEYEGVVPGTPPGQSLSFLATFDVRDGTAVVATLTALPSNFESLRSEIEPLLMSLQRT